MYSLVIGIYIIYTNILSVTSICSQNELIRQYPVDIRSDNGAWIDKVPGSRVEYNPFPLQFIISPRDIVKIEFRTSDPDGLLFMTGDVVQGDIVAAMLSDGYFSFLRHCDSGYTFERYPRKFDDDKWHTLEYIHSRTGGEVEIDGVNPFREYQIGPCMDFSTIIFGGLAPDMSLESWQGGNLDHRFRGCIRKLRINGKIALRSPVHVAVSSCP